MPNVNVFAQRYNVLGVAVSPSPATGFMFSSGTAANPYSGVNLLNYLPRVQSASTSLVVNQEDVNQYGQTARLGTVITSAPDITVNIDYLLLDGYAENLLGFAASGQQSFVSGLMDGTQAEKNYFIGVAPEGVDLIGATTNPNNINVIGIGNASVSNYSQTLAIGQIPRASITLSATNMQTYVGSTGKQSPAIDPNTALQVVGPRFTLPSMVGYTGVSIAAALRPGDIVLGLPRTGSFGDYTSGVGEIHVQGVSLSVPIGLDNILQLGNPYPIAKRIRFPVSCTLTVDALAADVAEDNVASLFCSNDPVDIYYQLRNPSCSRNGSNAMTVWFNQAQLVNRDWSSSIGQNSTVRLTYTNQLQGIGANYLGQGIVVSGAYGQYVPL
jgi:hypothetical protein